MEFIFEYIELFGQFDRVEGDSLEDVLDKWARMKWRYPFRDLAHFRAEVGLSNPLTNPRDERAAVIVRDGFGAWPMVRTVIAFNPKKLVELIRQYERENPGEQTTNDDNGSGTPENCRGHASAGARCRTS